MIKITLPTLAEEEAFISSQPPELHEHMRRTCALQRKVLEHLASLPELEDALQGLEALLGAYGSMASGLTAAGLQQCSNVAMQCSIHLAQVANTKRQQEHQATAAFGPSAMPPSPHTH